MTEQEKKEKDTTAEAAANEQYLQQMNNLSSLDNLLQAAENYRNGIRKEVWPTGFFTLDSELDGGLYGSQLICIGAVSSLGKTTFCLQAATQMAEQGKGDLFYGSNQSC